MKKFICVLPVLVIGFISTCVAGIEPTPAILREWAGYAGITDSTFKTPVISDESFTYVAATVIDSTTGPNIRVIRYDHVGDANWRLDWTGSGYGRDQAADIAIGSDSMIYVCGTTYSNATNDYDFLVLCISFNGVLQWAKTFNGTASHYDVATSIAVKDTDIYVTGVTYSSGTFLDYHTIKYDMNGNVIWQTDFDYNSLMDIPFQIAYSEEDSSVIVTGGSQSTVQDWDYQTVKYSIDGGLIYDNRVSGSAAGFDRAQAVTTDDSGYVYITGGTLNSTFDIKTAKFDKLGNLVWVSTIDHGGDDLATDIIVDNNGYVYICGTSRDDFYVAQLAGTDGGESWYHSIDGIGTPDSARAMCFDSYGNIVVTGQVMNSISYYYDFYTIAYTQEGTEVWHDAFDGPDHVDDNATNIASDPLGNIFVTGQVNIGGEEQTVTIKYRTDYFIEPPTVDTPSLNCLFYPNEGQLVDENDSSITDSVHYYTLKHYPQLYFGYGMMNMVWMTRDTSSSDSAFIQRVDVSFLDSSNPTQAFPSGENIANYLNYFLPQCPWGITNVYGYQSLVYTDVWSDIDVIYSSNAGGLKCTFVCNPGSYPNEIGLSFDGDSYLSIDHNWFLTIHASINDYSFEKPRVYQLDSLNNKIQLPWNLSWDLTNSNEASFTGWDSYDGNKPIIIEIDRSTQTILQNDSGLCWSTYEGGNGGEYAWAITCDLNHNKYIAGSTTSNDYPAHNGFSNGLLGNQWCTISKYAANDSSLWRTYWGGTDNQQAYDIKIKSNKDVYFCGYTQSPDFIRTPHAGAFKDLSYNGSQEGFISALDSTGTIPKWSTFFGSTGSDHAYGLDFDSNDNLFVVGDVANVDSFATRSPGGYYTQAHGSGSDGFIAKFDSNDSLVWCTPYGGNGDDWINSVKIDNANNICMGGGTQSSTFPFLNPGNGAFIDSTLGGTVDDFIVRFNSSGARSWATLIGGTGNEFVTGFGSYAFPSHRIAFDSQSNIFLVGSTESNNFPIMDGGAFFDSTYSHHDGFIMKFNHANFSQEWGTYISGLGHNEINSVDISSNDVLFCAGATSDSSFYLDPHVGVYFQDTLRGGYSQYANDGCLLAFDMWQQLIYGTYFGGHTLAPEGDFITSICVDDNSLFMTGYTSADGIGGSRFPLADPGNGAYFDSTYNDIGILDAFVSQICINSVISVDELTVTDSKLLIYPNPSKNNTAIEFYSGNASKSKIKIFNSYGSCVSELKLITNVGTNKVEIDMSNFTTGLYFVEVLMPTATIKGKVLKVE